MHRIDHPTKAADLHGAGKDGFTEGDPVAGIAPTVVTADLQNALQEEIANAIEARGIVLSKADNGQLAEALSDPLTALEASDLSNTGRLDNLEDRFSSEGIVEYPTALNVTRKPVSIATGQPFPGAWEYTTVGGATVWRSTAVGGELHVPLLPAIAAFLLLGDAVAFGNLSLVSATVTWKPGIGRTGTNRMQANLISKTLSGATLGQSIHGQEYSAASSAAWHASIVTPPSPVQLSHLWDTDLVINAGNDGDVNQDLVGAIGLAFTTTRQPV